MLSGRLPDLPVSWTPEADGGGEDDTKSDVDKGQRRRKEKSTLETLHLQVQGEGQKFASLLGHAEMIAEQANPTASWFRAHALSLRHATSEWHPDVGGARATEQGAGLERGRRLHGWAWVDASGQAIGQLSAPKPREAEVTPGFEGRTRRDWPRCPSRGPARGAELQTSVRGETRCRHVHPHIRQAGTKSSLDGVLTSDGARWDVELQ
jgi:hypothetical protein